MLSSKLKSELDRDGVIISYYGPLKQLLIENFATLLREQLEAYRQQQENSPSPIKIKTVQALFHIFVEQLQNVARYSSQLTLLDIENELLEHACGLIIAGKTQNTFYIECSNEIQLFQVDRLKQQLDTLRLLDKDALRALYKKRRREDPPEGSKGAGLGLIDVIRQTHKIEYTIEKTHDEKALFSLRLYV